VFVTVSAAERHQAPPLLARVDDACDMDRHADHPCREGEAHRGLERMSERGELFVLAAGID